MNKKLLSLITIPFIFVVLAVGVLIYMFLNPFKHEYYIFQNIIECENLIPSNQIDVNIELYDSPNSDKYIKDLQYEKFFGMNYKSNDVKYEIYAYEFEDKNSALEYYINVTGKTGYKKELPLDEDDENKLFGASKGMHVYRMIVVCQNKAYIIISPPQYENKISELLKNTFSENLY